MQLDMFVVMGLPATPQVAKRLNRFGRCSNYERWLAFYTPLCSRGKDGAK
jgi:hypothetical protein